MVAGGAEDDTLSVVDEAVSDAMDSDFGAGIDPEGQLGRARENEGLLNPLEAFAEEVFGKRGML